MKFRLILVGISLSFSVLAQEVGDAAFLAARDAFRAGDAARLERAVNELGKHELRPYAENYRLRIRMERDQDTSGIPAFLDQYAGTYVAEKLRADWIRWLGKQTAWSVIDAEFPKLLAPDTETQCLSLQARLARNDKSALDEADKLWQTMLEPPDTCAPVLDALVASQRLKADDVWERARRQMEANRPARAKKTLNYLPDSQIPDSKAFDAVVKNAMSFLAHQPASWASRRADRELAIYALQRIATNDPAFAAQELNRREKNLQAGELGWAWSQIALQAARKHLPDATAWYAKAGRTVLSEDNSQWRVRAALRNLDWGEVRDAIQAMPPALAERPEWIYWLGRAYKAGGKTTQADALFSRISDQANFYGNLAEEELGHPVTPPPKAAPPTMEEKLAAQGNPGLQRALAFFRLDMRIEGVREWNWALRGMEDRSLLAAADLARRNQIWDRAINTADRTKHEHDYTLRFLAPYLDQIRPAAQNQSLDDAWVYGLMRQESRFITTAKSSVGASGLMQLMPATARWVARKIGLRDYHHGKVNETETNVLLGTSYMRLVMENLDNHPVLASAAYNAGPGRARKWRADQPLEGAIYAETIPFSETRDYVKKVMSNSIYYSAIFNGKPDSLKARLGTVGPRNTEATKDADLP